MIYNTIGPIAQDNEATIENARGMAGGLDWSEYEVEQQDIGHARFEETVNGLDIYYDYAADYYFFVDPDYKPDSERFIADQYGSVYERGSDCNMFVGKLNGRTLQQFEQDYQ